MGNCYSLQKDHETALKNFQRAVQLDSRFSYAHTLCGHEYVPWFWFFFALLVMTGVFVVFSNGRILYLIVGYASYIFLAITSLISDM